MTLKFSKKHIGSLVFLITIAASALIITGCETDDDNKLASAQECLDKLRDTDPDASAQACADKVSGMTSPESYVIRCSVNFFLGGVKADELAAAYEEYDNASADAKAAMLMTMLAQDSTAESDATFNACKKSQVSSLIYLASISQVGTLILDAGPGGIGGFDPNNPDPGPFVDNCVNVPGDCDDQAIGEAVVTMYDVYCLGDAANNPTCTAVGSAIAASGGDPADVAAALYLLLQ